MMLLTQAVAVWRFISDPGPPPAREYVSLRVMVWPAFVLAAVRLRLQYPMREGSQAPGQQPLHDIQEGRLDARSESQLHRGRVKGHHHRSITLSQRRAFITVH